MTRLLRFADLQDHRVVSSWPQLKRLQQLHGFPLGRMLSPNVRTWTQQEVDDWIASRPVENQRPLQGASKANHERRASLEMGAGEPVDQAKIKPPKPRGSISAASRRTRSGPPKRRHKAMHPELGG
jgi:predicted DNA-binding transcriptional regulator AlpA